MDKINRIKTGPQKGILNGKALRKGAVQQPSGPRTGFQGFRRCETPLLPSATESNRQTDARYG